MASVSPGIFAALQPPATLCDRSAIWQDNATVHSVGRCLGEAVPDGRRRRSECSSRSPEDPLMPAASLSECRKGAARLPSCHDRKPARSSRLSSSCAVQECRLTPSVDEFREIGARLPERIQTGGTCHQPPAMNRRCTSERACASVQAVRLAAAFLFRPAFQCLSQTQLLSSPISVPDVSAAFCIVSLDISGHRAILMLVHLYEE